MAFVCVVCLIFQACTPVLAQPTVTVQFCNKYLLLCESHFTLQSIQTDQQRLHHKYNVLSLLTKITASACLGFMYVAAASCKY